jgi:hypothetical protein
MIRFYYHPTPNPAKVALFLEETGLPYEIVPVDTAKGEQHSAAFRADQPKRQSPGKQGVSASADAIRRAARANLCADARTFHDIMVMNWYGYELAPPPDEC